MLQHIANFWRPTLYLQIWSHRVRCVNITSGASFDDVPWMAMTPQKKRGRSVLAIGRTAVAQRGKPKIELANPFDHPRLLLSDCECAEAYLKRVFRPLCHNGLFTPAPRVLLQPMEKLEGGITQIEHRALREVVLGAGAAQVIVYNGPEFEPPAFNWSRLTKQLGAWSPR